MNKEDDIKRKMVLVAYGFYNNTDKIILSKTYDYKTQSQEKQLAMDLAKKLGYKDGDGEIQVLDMKDNVIKKIPIEL